MFDVLKKALKKFVEVISVSMWEVESDIGWNKIESINKTVEYEVYKVKLINGMEIECADNHIFIDDEYNEVFAKDCLNKNIMTLDGSIKVISVEKQNRSENMYDLSLSDDNNHLYYTNGILSHNTTMMTVYALWLANFNPDQTIYILANNKETAAGIFESVMLAYKELPGWVKAPLKEKNKSSMVFNNGSKIRIAPTTKAGIRGRSVSCLILDEFAFVERGIQNAFWTSVTPTLSANPNAKLFISSTPNGTDNIFYQIVNRATLKKNEFKIEKVIWSDVKGRGEMWKRKTIANDCNGDEEKFKQEYECKFIGSFDSPFNSSVFERLEKNVRPPEEIRDEGRLYIWERPQNARVYVMGCDVAEGVGEDASVATIIDVTDLRNAKQVATFYDNKITPSEFTEKIADLAAMYGNPVLAIERNSVGTEVCNAMHFQNRYPNLVSYGQNRDKQGTGKNFRAGIQCTQNTKSPAISNFRYWVTNNFYCVIRDERFVNELKHFLRKNYTGSWSADAGYHDDVIMSIVWALASISKEHAEEYFIVEGKEKNGIPKKVINKFHYIIDKLESDLLSSKFDDKNINVPICVFGRIGWAVTPTSTNTFESLLSQGWEVYNP